MVRIVLAAVLVLGLWQPVTVQAQVQVQVQVQDRPIQEVINGQIDAFLMDDFAAAFSFASPSIRQFFGNSENFGAMVRQGFPMVWRPADVRFLKLRERGGRVLQDVMIRDGAGVFHVLEYQMVPGENGWQINGVRLLEAPPVGV